jgi:methylmalonyl-CoA mutase
MSNKTQNLFDEFAPISTQDWENVIIQDLKGADYNKKLIWKTAEGFDVKPYYRQENTENIDFTNSLPSQFPYVRGNKTDNNWKICQDIEVFDLKTANKIAIDAFEKGANAVTFILNDKNLSETDFESLLKNISFEENEVNFAGKFSVKNLVGFLEKNKSLKASIHLDPLANLATRGYFCVDENSAFDDVKFAIEAISKIENNNKNASLRVERSNLKTDEETERLLHFVRNDDFMMKAFSVNLSNFHNSGANAVQEIAYGLSATVEYFNKLTDKNLTIDQIAPKMKLLVSCGSNYFMEIAKIRAIRLLWAKVIEAYKPKNVETCKVFIHTESSEWNKTIFDSYVNLLRTTTETMAAAVAGVEMITVKPFDFAFQNQNEFSDRIARNTQIVLKEEVNIDKVVDASAGSYYIENLTLSLIEKSWNLFLEIENEGGFLEAFKKGIVQEQIKNSSQKRDLDIAMRREIILGTNQYANVNERVANKIQKANSLVGVVTNKHSDKFVGDNTNKGEIAEPIKKYRGAQAFEELRLKTEKFAKTPKVFLFTYGNFGMRKARAMFASNFFACAGFEIIDNLGFKTIEEGVKSVIESKAEIIVICSSDEEYPEIVPQIASAFVGVVTNKILVVAGNPVEHIETFKNIGVTNFIHLKSNVLETLRKMIERLEN